MCVSGGGGRRDKEREAAGHLPPSILFFLVRSSSSSSSSVVFLPWAPPSYPCIPLQHSNMQIRIKHSECTYTYIYKCTVYVCIYNQPSYRDEAVKVNDPNTKYSDEVCRNTHRTPHVPCTGHANGKCRKIMTSLNNPCIKLRTRTFTHANILMETFVHR